MNDGGPAFPQTEFTWTQSNVPVGLSIRDYFAAAALTGLASTFPQAPVVKVDVQNLSQSAYGIADAMIKEREKGK